MAELSSTDRARITGQAQRMNGSLGSIGALAMTKADLRAAVDATDTWIDTNAASYVAALPAAFRNNSSAIQKTVLFCYVALRRAGIFPAEEDNA